jgi:hypothetical protein
MLKRSLCDIKGKIRIGKEMLSLQFHIPLLSPEERKRAAALAN